jgi:hypothetical protein
MEPAGSDKHRHDTGHGGIAHDGVGCGEPVGDFRAGQWRQYPDCHLGLGGVECPVGRGPMADAAAVSHVPGQGDRTQHAGVGVGYGWSGAERRGRECQAIDPDTMDWRYWRAPAPKTAQTNLLVCDPVTVDLAEPMSLGYIVINNGSGDPTKVLAALASAGDALSVAGSQSMQAAISQGVASFTSTQIVGALMIAIPVLGTALAAIEGWLLSKLTGVVLANCDGLVAVELRALIGRDLYILTGNGTRPVTVTVQHPGTDSEPGCGGNSDYEVTWTIRPL